MKRLILGSFALISVFCTCAMAALTIDIAVALYTGTKPVTGAKVSMDSLISAAIFTALPLATSILYCRATVEKRVTN